VISDTKLRDVRTHCSHDPRNLVTKHGWRRNDVVSSEQQVGVAQPRRLHVDENLASYGRDDVHILEIEPSTECIEYECLRSCPLSCLGRFCQPTALTDVARTGTTWQILANFAIARVRASRTSEAEQPRSRAHSCSR